MRTTLERHRDPWMQLLVAVWAIVGLLLLVAAVGWVLGKVSPALVPFGLALVVVFVFRGPVAALEKRGWKRGPAIAVCYLVGAIVVGVAAVFIVPPLFDQIRQFVAQFPNYYDRAYGLWLQMQDRYQALVVPAWLEDAMMNLRATVTEQAASLSAALAKEAFAVGGQAVQMLFNMLLGLVVGFWILKDLPAIKSEFVLLAGPRRREEASVVAEKISRVLGGYLRGQLIMAVVTGTIVAIGLTVIGVPYSLVIGLIAAVLNFIPWLGPAVTALVAAIAAAFVSPLHIVLAIAIEIGAQQTTEIFIQPRVMSEQVDLHPLLVIFSLLAGGTLFGFVGLLLAIPVAAIAKALFVYYFEKYTDSKLTSEGGALFKARADDAGSGESCAEPVATTPEEGGS